MLTPRNHHYVPQFYLRNFAVDTERKKLTTVTKHDHHLAVWGRRSIKSLGYERDLYVAIRQGVPISVESIINQRIETPISESDTWAKIVSNRSDALDQSDKPILYALIRHLHVRTPHHHAVTMELARLAAENDAGMAFTEEEREHYAHIYSHPNEAKAMFALMSMSTSWAEAEYKMAALSIWRSPIPICTLSSPVVSTRAPAHPALHLPRSGLTPFHLTLALNPTTIASLVLGDFDGAFVNVEVPEDTARGFNRHLVGHFSLFDGIRHLISHREGLVNEMDWAQYSLLEE